MKIIQFAAVSLLAVACFAVAACGSSSVTIRGTVTPSSNSSSVFGPGMTATSYAACSLASPAPGSQVTVTDPSGKVIGTGTLGFWSNANTTVSGTTVYPCEMPFTIQGVSSEPRYGFHIDGVPGTIWETTISHVSLDVSSGN